MMSQDLKASGVRAAQLNVEPIMSASFVSGSRNGSRGASSPESSKSSDRNIEGGEAALKPARYR